MKSIKAKLTKIGKYVLNFIFVLIILITIIFTYGFIQMKITNSKCIDIFGYTIMQVVTGSMAPTINEQDIIIEKITKDINVQDVITYDNGKSLITHRVINIAGDEITTKGDANNSKDKQFSKNQVVGKVVFTFKNIRIWKKVITSPSVIISFIITICLIYFSFAYKK